MQIEAAASLRYLIELDEAEEPVLAVLPDVLNEYFRIMQEIGLDEVKSPFLCARLVMLYPVFLHTVKLLSRVCYSVFPPCSARSYHKQGYAFPFDIFTEKPRI